MIEQPSPSQQPMLPWRRMLLQVVSVFLTLVIAGIAIALGLFIGRKTAADQWHILVKAVGGRLGYVRCRCPHKCAACVAALDGYGAFYALCLSGH